MFKKAFMLIFSAGCFAGIYFLIMIQARHYFPGVPQWKVWLGIGMFALFLRYLMRSASDQQEIE